MKESDRFPTDDITWCWSDCVTDCPRQPKYIRDNSIPHSFADFSSKCVAYTPKEQTMKSYEWWLGRKARVRKKYTLLLGRYLSPKELRLWERSRR